MNRQQFAAAGFLALLSPMVRIVPGSAAALGGYFGWLGAIPAFVFLFFFGRWILRFAGNEPQGMGPLFLRCLGPGIGRAVVLLYALAFLFYAGFILRVGADRLIAAVYPASGPTVFVGVMLLLCLTAALGKLSALGRTAVILRTMMLAVLALVFVMALRDISLPHESVLPALGKTVLAAAPMANVGGFALCFSFLGGYTEKNSDAGRVYLPWLGILCLVMLLSCLSVTGRFGPTLTAELRYPFFTMARDLSLLHLGDRVEALIVGMWVFSDFVLCTLLLRSAHETLRLCFGLAEPESLPYFSLRGGRWLLLAETALAGVFAAVIAWSAAGLVIWSERIVPFAFAGLVFLGFPAVWLIGKLRKKI